MWKPPVATLILGTSLAGVARAVLFVNRLFEHRLIDFSQLFAEVSALRSPVRRIAFECRSANGLLPIFLPLAPETGNS
jgi:hypothetical protein